MKSFEKIVSKIKDTDAEIIALYFFATLFFCSLGANMIYNTLDENRTLYTPGETIPRKNRVIVENLYPYELAPIKREYEMYYKDYRRIKLNAERENFVRRGRYPLPQGHKMPITHITNPTVADYLRFLKKYEKNVVEKKYQKLNKQLSKQK